MFPTSTRGTGSERGIALVAALLVLTLVAAVAGTFIVSATSERAITSGVHTARGALLAADAGVRAMTEVLADSARNRLAACASAYSGSGPLITNPATLFPSAASTLTCANPGFTASGTLAFMDSTLGVSSQTYNYLYTITSTGTFGGVGARQVQSTGVLRLSADRGSFADYLMFTDVHTMSGGGAVYFTSNTNFNGRVHTNGEFRFANSPTFLDLVTSVSGKAWYRNAPDSPVELDSDHNGTRDVPSFDGGFERGVSPIALPTNAYSQQSAALGLGSAASAALPNSAINAALGLGSGSGAPPNGIYLVNAGGAVTGGIYVQGALDRMSMVADTVNHVQVYTLQQGGTTKIITVDPAAGTTTVRVGAATTTYAGTPLGISYVNGALDNLGGPDRAAGGPPPALLDGQQMLVAATGDVVIQKDLTMDHYNTGAAVLGIYSSGGNVRIGTGAPNDLCIDAFVMATGASASFQVDSYNSGAPRGAVNLRGGMVARYYGAFGQFDAATGAPSHGYGRNFQYDRRGLIPPYFPKTGRLIPNFPSAHALAWKEI